MSEDPIEKLLSAIHFLKEDLGNVAYRRIVRAGLCMEVDVEIIDSFPPCETEYLFESVPNYAHRVDSVLSAHRVLVDRVT